MENGDTNDSDKFPPDKSNFRRDKYDNVDSDKLNNLTNCSSDPYSVSNNVDSKTNVDKCHPLRTHMVASSDYRQSAKCSCSLKNVLSDTSNYTQSCEENDDVKITNTEIEPLNGSDEISNSSIEMHFNINVHINSDSERPSCSKSTFGNDFNSPPESSAFGKFNCKRPIKNREKKPHLAEPEDSSSDTGNDDYSVGSEDGCIYTYRGGEHLSDLPSSFISLDMGMPGENNLPLLRQRNEPAPDENGGNSRASSPDMDFLEMDFDPGPSCEIDSDKESSLDIDLENLEANKAEGNNNNDIEVGENIPSETNGKIPLTVLPKEIFNSKKKSSFNGNQECEAGSSKCNLNVDKKYPNDFAGPSTSQDRCAPSEDRNLVQNEQEPLPSTSGIQTSEISSNILCGTLIPHTTVSGEVIYVRKTSLSWPAREVPTHLGSSGDLVPPGDASNDHESTWSYVGGAWLASPEPELSGVLEASRANLSSTLFHSYMAKKLVVVDNLHTKFLQNQDTSNEDGGDASDSEGPPAFPRCMIWSEREACSRQFTQIATSACGATAVINSLLALNLIVDSATMERVTAAVCTKQRANNATLCQYLFSRSVAGCCIKSLAAGLHAGSNGTVYSRFFPMWPERCISLSHWLAYWIELGAVPIVTLNLQSGVVDPNKIPDSWHHQMIFGVGPRGIYMVNPLECVEEGALWHQLCSDSMLLVKRKDILSRWNRQTDLSPLMNVSGDERWESMNVLGQVVNIIRESHNSSDGHIRSTHIKIPACYQAGITIAVVIGSEAHKRLLQAPDLPLAIPN